MGKYIYMLWKQTFINSFLRQEFIHYVVVRSYLFKFSSVISCLFVCHQEASRIYIELCLSFSDYVSKDQGYLWGFFKSIICILWFLYIVCCKLKSDLCDWISTSKFHTKMQSNAHITVNAKLFYWKYSYYFTTVTDVYACDMSWLFICLFCCWCSW